jgi:hypothetical protein
MAERPHRRMGVLRDRLRIHGDIVGPGRRRNPIGKPSSKGRRIRSPRDAPFSWELTDELRCTHLDHSDPADRILAATADAYGLMFVTADKPLVRIGPMPGVLGSR